MVLILACAILQILLRRWPMGLAISHNGRYCNATQIYETCGCKARGFVHTSGAREHDPTAG
jgi:hypothetical protein